MIAAGDLGWVFIVLLVAGAILANLFTEKLKKKDGTPNDPRGSDSPRPNRPIANQQSEEERLRRFLEALGVPNTPPAAPPPAQPKPVAPKPYTPPAKPYVAPAPVQQRPHVQQPPRSRPVIQPPTVRVPLPPRPVEQPKPEPTFQESLQQPDKFEEASNSIEQAGRDFDASLLEHGPTTPDSMTEMSVPQRGTSASTFDLSNPTSDRVAAALKAPGNLRTLIVLREVLGPPLSMQE